MVATIQQVMSASISSSAEQHTYWRINCTCTKLVDETDLRLLLINCRLLNEKLPKLVFFIIKTWKLGQIILKICSGNPKCFWSFTYSRRGKYKHRGKYNHCALRRRFHCVKKNFPTFSFFAVNFKQIHTRNKKKKFEKKIPYWLKRRF
jgi:hypothetical protein